MEHFQPRMDACVGGFQRGRGRRDARCSLAGARGSRDPPRACRSSWTDERPIHLQQLKKDPVFDAVRSPRPRAAIEAALRGQPDHEPKNCGAFFLAFPSNGAWGVPTSGWHIDANYLSALAPPAGVRTHALFGDVDRAAAARNSLSGSHRLVHKWFKDHPPPTGAHGAEHRLCFKAIPTPRPTHGWRHRDAHRPLHGSRGGRGRHPSPSRREHGLGRLTDSVHPLVLHVAASNTGRKPRFLLSGGVDTPAMYADSKWGGRVDGTA